MPARDHGFEDLDRLPGRQLVRNELTRIAAVSCGFQPAHVHHEVLVDDLSPADRHRFLGAAAYRTVQRVVRAVQTARPKAPPSGPNGWTHRMKTRAPLPPGP